MKMLVPDTKDWALLEYLQQQRQNQPIHKSSVIHGHYDTADSRGLWKVGWVMAEIKKFWLQIIPSVQDNNNSHFQSGGS